MRRIEEGAQEMSAQSEERGDGRLQEMRDQQGNEDTGTETMEAALDQVPQRQADVSTPEMDEEAPPANPMPTLPAQEAARQITNLLRDDPRRYRDSAVDGPQGDRQVDGPQSQQQADMDVENVWAGLN